MGPKMKKEGMEMGLRRGDIVWTRAQYPISWCPALVLRIDLFGVLLSFFDSHPPPRYFLQSELRSFHLSFRSLIGTVSPCDGTLNRALLLLGRRLGLSLTCPCQEPPERNSKEKSLAGVGWSSVEQVVEAANCFLPAEALGFMLDAAVSPWIEDEDLLIAVTASAVIKRFRRYASMKQKLKYLEEDTVTISEEDGALEEERHASREQLNSNTTVCITNATVTKESLKPLHEVRVNCFPLKRHAEHPYPAHHCFKLRKTKPFFSLSRAYAYLQENEDSVKIGLYDAFTLGSLVLFDVPLIKHTSHCTKPFWSLSRAYAYLQENGDSVKIGLYDAFTLGSLVLFDVPLIKHTSHCTTIVEIHNFKGHKKSDDIVNGATYIASVSMVDAQRSNVSSKDKGTCKSNDDVPRSTKRIRNVDEKVDCISLVQPSASKLLLNKVPGDHAINEDVGSDKLVTTKHLLSTNNELNGEFHKPSTVDLSLNSELDQQSTSPEYGDSKMLHMKFTKGYYRPSKEELIKKFSSFGTIDPLNTKVSPYTGAAKVVFLNHIDAVTAYQYAKRKKLFLAQGNVQFSLYPFNCKKEVNYLCPLSSSPLKSCLKRSSFPVEDEKIPHRVRFVMKS